MMYRKTYWFRGLEPFFSNLSSYKLFEVYCARNGMILPAIAFSCMFSLFLFGEVQFNQVNWIGKLHELYQKKLGMDRKTQKQEIRFDTEKKPGNGIHQLMFRSTVHAQEFKAGPFVGDECTTKKARVGSYILGQNHLVKDIQGIPRSFRSNLHPSSEK